MRVLVNASTLIKGGALQVAASLFAETSRPAQDIEWHWLISKVLRDELEKLGLPLDRSDVYTIDRSPARHRASRMQVAALERQVGPAVVFTLFGPAYVNFISPHLCGVADGWVTHAGIAAFRKLPDFKSVAQMLLTVAYKSFWFRRADAWMVEARVAKRGLMSRHHLPQQAISIVPNSFGPQFSAFAPARAFPAGARVRILTMAAYYPHKNLESIPLVAKEMRRQKPDLSFEFVLTIDPTCEGAKRLERLANVNDVGAFVRNIGHVDVSRTRAVYEECDLLFLPSILETSSANFPEAMAMGLPIVTTEFGFNRDVCGEAARYYKADSVEGAASAIISLLMDRSLWTAALTAAAILRSELPDPRAKVAAYVSCVRQLAQRHG